MWTRRTAELVRKAEAAGARGKNPGTGLRLPAGCCSASAAAEPGQLRTGW